MTFLIVLLSIVSYLAVGCFIVFLLAYIFNESLDPTDSLDCVLAAMGVAFWPLGAIVAIPGSLFLGVGWLGAHSSGWGEKLRERQDQ